MEEVIFTHIHYGGTFVENPDPNYHSFLVPIIRYIEKDYFSLMELFYYTRELGYLSVGGFFYQDANTREFNVIESDRHLLDLIKDLKNEDPFHVYVLHSLDTALAETDRPVGLLKGPKVSSSPTRSSKGVGAVDNLDKKGVGAAADNLDHEGVWSTYDSLDQEGVGVTPKFVYGVEASNLSDCVSSDSDLGEIPPEDGSDIDEELRAIRQERRRKQIKKKKVCCNSRNSSWRGWWYR
ncbi:uncharacterized protein LOC132599406 [Lycium barbarum]|uniref:uncharacterized protein LOC132599406 n=1 Tax=Lycium barbarum TaxID=112863 RepID=UPI00293EACD9|nr:uncharacterized protein LOC132599406 [Lycium barbarum]